MTNEPAIHDDAHDRPKEEELFLLQRMREHADQPAVARGDETHDYRQLLESFAKWRARFQQLQPGQVVSLEGEYGRETIAALLAAIDRRLIAVPLSSDARAQHETFRRLAQVEARVWLDVGDSGAGVENARNGEAPAESQFGGGADGGSAGASPSRTHVESTGVAAAHPLYDRLRTSGKPGLVLFTSGSTGESKAAVHDLNALLEKFRVPRAQLRTLVFLQLDHIGGVNTLLYTLANGGMVVAPAQRTPQAVCQAIARHRVQLLPTSPTFLNLLLLSGETRRHDLSSLERITYGTEPMPPSTLARLAEEFPGVTLQQTYGLTELGILRSKSRDSQSLWVRVGGEGYETKVVDGRLWIRAASAMLGYLNAPSPFDADGFFDTQDRVEVDGEWLRILGRQSEIINVGGSKVYPAEVESVLLQIPGVLDAAVCGQEHPLTGQIVTATIQLESDEPARDFRTRMRLFCKDRLPSHAVPAKISFSDLALHNARFKRMRTRPPTETPS